MELKILKGDNLELLKQYPDNYFDSVVTDCPYGLGKEPNAIKLLQDWIDHGYHEIKGKGFMGKSWDAFVPQPSFWKEVYRVLKPGGYVLAFFGTRTYDWGTLAIRLAGFEIRDMICWHYGSGFPKSLDISKQLDKMAGAEREIVATKETGADNKKSKDGMRIAKKTHVNENGKTVFNITGATSDQAKQWDGWGTALKPATEPICVARKPLDGTVSENILKWGTGGINLDECRIDFKNDADFNSATYGTGTNIIGGNFVGSKLIDGRKNIEANPEGRFPANVIFDPFMANELDKQTDYSKSQKPKIQIQKGKNSKGIYGDYKSSGNLISVGFGDEGGASRFFYCAKASQFERNAGCEDLILWEKQDQNLKMENMSLPLKDISDDIVQYLKDQEWNTTLFGRQIMDQSPKDFKFIIKMMTKLIIELKTWSYSQPLNIREYIQDVIKMIPDNGLNLAENAEYLKKSKLIIINEKTEYLRGVFNVVFQVLLKIKSEGKIGNSHSTVKPISLMSYLQRLVTPPGGKTLDPFAGSGTSGCSAYFENIGECVLMELDEDGTYIPIIEARTKYWSIEYNRRKYLEDLKEPEKQPENQMKLF